MKAKNLLKIIPPSVRITKTVSYEVLYVDKFEKDDKQLGECRPDPKQILIKKTESPTEVFKTLLHEAIHAMSFENEINLTEAQVEKLEDSIFRVLKLNKILDKL